MRKAEAAGKVVAAETSASPDVTRRSWEGPSELLQMEAGGSASRRSRSSLGGDFALGEEVP